jgi:TonB family protein
MDPDTSTVNRDFLTVESPQSPWLAEEVISLFAGGAFTFAIFFAMAHLESVEPASPPAEMLDLREMSVPFDAPPPKPLEVAEPTEAVTLPLTGIEIGASESPVKIAVVSPDLASLFPEAQLAPPAMMRIGRLDTGLKPRMDVSTDIQHVYQTSEVDQIPTVLDREDPRVPPHIRNGAKLLRVTVIVLIDMNGAPKSVRLLKSSGNSGFDGIAIESIKQTWVFSPAMKNRKRVNCLIQQTVSVRWAGGSAFEVSP